MSYINPYFFKISMVLYFLSALAYLIYTSFKKSQGALFASIILFIGFIIHTAGIVVRWIETYRTGYGYVPLSNMYESLVFFSWCIVLFYLIMERKFKQKKLGVLVTPLAFLSLALTSIIPGVKENISPLIPALQSDWLTIHVITCFLGYSAFAISFGISILYLIQEKKGAERFQSLPSLSILDEINYKVIITGFPLLSLGIITGAAWAKYAWGTYWSWDPKETWSLITWLIYAAILHARYTYNWKGKKSAIFSIIGFAAVLFTYFGVNYLIVGLHSYV